MGIWLTCACEVFFSQHLAEQFRSKQESPSAASKAAWKTKFHSSLYWISTVFSFSTTYIEHIILYKALWNLFCFFQFLFRFSEKFIWFHFNLSEFLLLKFFFFIFFFFFFLTFYANATITDCVGQYEINSIKLQPYDLLFLNVWAKSCFTSLNIIYFKLHL